MPNIDHADRGCRVRPFCHLIVRQQTLAGNHNSVRSRRRWSAIVGIANAISKPGAFCQASIAGRFFASQQWRPIRIRLL
jgi:hypothetical protein